VFLPLLPEIKEPYLQLFTKFAVGYWLAGIGRVLPRTTPPAIRYVLSHFAISNRQPTMGCFNADAYYPLANAIDAATNSNSVNDLARY